MKIIDMYEFRRVLVVFVILGCMAICDTCFSERPATGSMSREDLSKKKDPEMVFYGKVIDQFDQPVEDAKITVGRRTIKSSMEYRDLPPITVETDKNGQFEVKAKGIWMSIRLIEKDAYEYSRIGNPKGSYECSEWEGGTTFFSESKNPVVFRLRKRGHPAYLTKVGKKIISKPGEIVGVSLDFFRHWIPASGRALTDAEVDHKDIKISVSSSEDNTSYEITFASLDEDSGIILSEDLLYEAPEEGYTPEIKVSLNSPDDVGDTVKYFYVKARAEVMYSRLKVKFDLARTMGLRVSISGLTNPDDSRNLEYDSKYQFEEEQWRENVRDRHYKEKRKAKQEKRKFDEEAFIKKILKDKAERDKKEKKDNPKWWHKLEEKAKVK